MEAFDTNVVLRVVYRDDPGQADRACSAWQEGAAVHRCRRHDLRLPSAGGKNYSAKTKAYLSTLAQVSQKNCHQNCPLIACVPVTNPQCSVPSGSTGTIGTCASGLP